MCDGRSIAGAVEQERAIMEQVFPDPQASMAAFIHRLFEQRIQARPALPPCSLLASGDKRSLQDMPLVLTAPGFLNMSASVLGSGHLWETFGFDR